MGLFSKVKRMANKAKRKASRVGRGVVRGATNTAKRHGRKLLKRAIIAGVATGGTAFAGPVAGATLAKLSTEVL